MELTKDFTPEISEYKVNKVKLKSNLHGSFFFDLLQTGNVQKFDAKTDEITMKLNDDYNRGICLLLINFE